jgi:hypothetical protein
VGLETERGGVLREPMRLVEPDPAKELVGRIVEDDEIVADVHVAIVVDPFGSNHVAVLVERCLDHAMVLKRPGSIQ